MRYVLSTIDWLWCDRNCHAQCNGMWKIIKNKYNWSAILPKWPLAGGHHRSPCTNCIVRRMHECRHHNQTVRDHTDRYCTNSFIRIYEKVIKPTITTIALTHVTHAKVLYLNLVNYVISFVRWKWWETYVATEKWSHRISFYKLIVQTIEMHQLNAKHCVHRTWRSELLFPFKSSKAS